MKKYVAYYRVSTQKQGGDGYGVAAQRTAVRNFTGCKDGSCIEKEFIEVESGKNNKRPILKEAFSYCKKHNCALIISKLDRLSRNAAFLHTLKDSGINFKCVDLPDLNTLTLGVFAAFAQHEAERISLRTKEALAARKANGLTKKVVNNLTSERIKAGHEAIRNNARNAKEVIQVVPIIKSMRKEGKTYREIAVELTEREFKTRRGKENEETVWNPIQVQRIDKRFEN
jgi:DNA invertase Pin-like site-specific DNA recombinase